MNLNAISSRNDAFKNRAMLTSSLGASFEENETTFEESYEIKSNRGDVPMPYFSQRDAFK